MSISRKIKSKFYASNGFAVFGMVLVTIGYLVMAFSTIANVGYCLYLWATDLTLALALWTAFKSWIITLVSGILTVILGLIITAVSE